MTKKIENVVQSILSQHDVGWTQTGLESFRRLIEREMGCPVRIEIIDPPPKGQAFALVKACVCETDKMYVTEEYPIYA